VTTYATPEDLKARLKNITNQHDTELLRALNSASRWVEKYCSRIFYQSSSAARTFEACDSYLLKLGPFSDLVSITSLKTDPDGDGTFETTWSSGDYQLLPVNRTAHPEQLPITEIKAVGSQSFPLPVGLTSRNNRVEITGVWGWPAVPESVKEATLIKATQVFRRKDSPFGVAELGEGGLVRLKPVDPDVADLLSDYALDGIA
jgi:hypothetical protein